MGCVWQVMNPPTCGWEGENETMLVSVTGHVKIQPDSKQSDGLFQQPWLAVLRKCHHYTLRGNNTVEINGSISQPSSPTLVALPFSATLGQ